MILPVILTLHSSNKACMRIALVSTLRTPVPPVRMGSVELLVGLMAEEMARRGEDVTVFAPGDSTVSTRLLSILPKGYHFDPTIWDWELAEFMQIGFACEHAEEFDVISSHVYCYALPFSRLIRTPIVHTFHICPTPDFVRYCQLYPEGNYVLISNYQRKFFGDLQIAAVIHNGVDTSSFPFDSTPGSYLAFIGDIRPDKGPLEAIRLARAAGVPIRLAGSESEYFHNAIKPELDGRNVEYVGELDHDGKVAFLRSALGLVFVGEGEEACPLVVIEAMACGTPVLALHRGPIPELVTQSVSGIYSDDLSDLVRHVKHLVDLDRRRIRLLAVEKFGVSRMVDQYLATFDRVLQSTKTRR
jgi:glycosyltransferase involved in cell wall biosynthesis